MIDTTPTFLEGKKILVIDDDEFTVLPAISLLESRGATVRFRDSLEKGLDLLEKADAEKTFDLVLIDLRFPNGIPAKLRKHLDRPDEENAFQRYGLALGGWLKKHRPALPFIYYTVLPARSDDPGITVDKLKAGPLELLNKVQEHLRIRQGE